MNFDRSPGTKYFGFLITYFKKDSKVRNFESTKNRVRRLLKPMDIYNIIYKSVQKEKELKFLV